MKTYKNRKSKLGPNVKMRAPKRFAEMLKTVQKDNTFKGGGAMGQNG